MSTGLGAQDRHPGEVLAAREGRTTATLHGIKDAIRIDQALEPHQERSARVGGRPSRVVAGMLRERAEPTESRELF